jgi:hypothetical protein
VARAFLESIKGIKKSYKVGRAEGVGGLMRKSAIDVAGSYVSTLSRAHL